MSNQLFIEGELSVIYPEAQITEKFKKREFVVITKNGEYSEHVKMQLTQDRCSLLDSLQLGASVKVSFNLRGKPYEKNGETMYFTNIDAWRIEATTQQAPQAQPKAYNAPLDAVLTKEEQDDLPF